MTDTGEIILDQADSVKEKSIESLSPVRVKTRPKSRIATGIMSNEVQIKRPMTPKKILLNTGINFNN